MGRGENAGQRARLQATKKRIFEDTGFALRVFRTIYARQKPEEQFTRQHMGSDGRGFVEHETEDLNRLYERLEAGEWRLTPSEADRVRAAMRKYAGQYLRANREETERKRSEFRGRRTSDPAKTSSKAPSRAEDAAGNGRPRRKSPRPRPDDDLSFMRELPLDDRLEWIEKMADKMGV